MIRKCDFFKNGVDILCVSKMLCHKDVSITLKIYTKFIKEDDNLRINKLKKMEKLFGKI